MDQDNRRDRPPLINILWKTLRLSRFIANLEIGAGALVSMFSLRLWCVPWILPETWFRSKRHSQIHRWRAEATQGLETRFRSKRPSQIHRSQMLKPHKDWLTFRLVFWDDEACSIKFQSRKLLLKDQNKTKDEESK